METHQPQTEIEIVTLDRWLEVVDRCAPAKEVPEYRRREPRRVAEGAARVLLILDEDDPKRARGQECALVEVSGSGLMVRSPGQFPERASVQVDLFLEETSCTVWGKIVHCTSTLGGYKVGVRLRFFED